LFTETKQKKSNILWPRNKNLQSQSSRSFFTITRKYNRKQRIKKEQKRRDDAAMRDPEGDENRSARKK
jgi:hypothetical protein